jgi:serine/threonine protein kinase
MGEAEVFYPGEGRCLLGRSGKSDDLEKGSDLGGLILGERLSSDDFSSVWLTEAVKGGLPESCIRAIPAAHFRSPEAYERLLAEVSFWHDLSGRCAVDLYDCGLARRHYYMVMRYLREGSAADWMARGALADRLEHFAADFASALRELHGAASAHGNLKPSNVFPLPDGGVLFSDFAMPLWADEMEQGCRALEPHLNHPYQDAQQREDVRDFDTRSDVYAFGLILLRCVTGVEPDPSTPIGRIDRSQWPGQLGAVVQRCLAPTRSDRPGDGFELFDMLSSSLVFMAGSASSPAESDEVDLEGDPSELLDRARALIEKGSLTAALDVLETLPPGMEGAEELVDEIERRHKACEVLVQEAVALAGLGKPQAAMDAISEAEKLRADSDTVAAVKAELAAAAGQDEALLQGRMPKALLDALEAQRYPVARTHVEKVIRFGVLSDDALEVIRRFKKGRVRKAFLDGIAGARRLYVLGHHREAAREWVEAARWLPSGPERSRLRHIAEVAGRGDLVVDVQKLGLSELQEEKAGTAGFPSPPASPSESSVPPAEPAQARKAPARRLRLVIVTLACILLGCLALLIVMALARH